MVKNMELPQTTYYILWATSFWVWVR